MRGLKDRTVIVTGGGNGIGAAVCRRFGEEGAKVAIWDIDKDAACARAEEVRAAGGRECWRVFSSWLPGRLEPGPVFMIS